MFPRVLIESTRRSLQPASEAKVVAVGPTVPTDVRLVETAAVRLSETADVRIAETANVRVTEPIDLRGPVTLGAPESSLPVEVRGVPLVSVMSAPELYVAPTVAARTADARNNEAGRLDMLAATLIQTGAGGLIAGVALGITIAGQPKVVHAIMGASAGLGGSALLALLSAGRDRLPMKRLLTGLSRVLLLLSVLGGCVLSIALYHPSPFK
jgi:hypothetical protein